MCRHLWGVAERQQSDEGLGLKAIAQLLRVQERKARLMGLDAPTRRAVDVITHGTFVEMIGDLVPTSRAWRPMRIASPDGGGAPAHAVAGGRLDRITTRQTSRRETMAIAIITRSRRRCA